MPASTAKGFPYPLTSDPFLPATTDFPALAAAIESKTAREVAAVLSAAAILDVGVSGQVRAGRELVATDFTTLLGLGTPVGLWDAGSLTNLGSGGNLTNKGTVPLTAKGLAGTANHAALFAGSTGQALYIADTGSSDPFRIKTGSWGCWQRTAKRSVNQHLLSKDNGGAWSATGYDCYVDGTTQQFAAECNPNGSGTGLNVHGVTDVADDRWHFLVATYDGSVLRVYVDGALEGSVSGAGPIAPTDYSGPFNVGGYGASSGVNASNPHFGRIAVPFVTADVLNEDQIRLLMAAKVAHGYSTTPTRSSLAIRRKRKGLFAAGDFTATPKRLYAIPAGSNVDSGTNGANASTGGTVWDVAGPDGQQLAAKQFDGSTGYLSATDTGLPSGTAARTVGIWFKTTAALGTLVWYGTTNPFQIYVNSQGWLKTSDQTSFYGAAPVVNDGQWHFGVVIWDPSPTDGQKVKTYVDGKLASGSTVAPLSTTLAGAGGLLIGKGAGASATDFVNGAVTRVFVTDYAMAEDEILNLYAKGSVALGASEKNSGENVLAMDATNVYAIFDDLNSQDAVDLRVAA